MSLTDAHGGQPPLQAGEPLVSARAALVLAHGRGASAQDILALAGELGLEGFACLAPQAAGGTWYPNRFLAPTTDNEPWLSSALAALDRAVQAAAQAGIPLERIALAGFSQGACLALEYAARHARRYGALIGFSGALIGAEGEARHDAGSLEGTPVFLGCSDRDAHIPARRVTLTAEVLRALGAVVDARLYPGMGHTVNDEELEAARALLKPLAERVR